MSVSAQAAWALLVMLLVTAEVTAGEIVFKDGRHLEGQLAGDVLAVWTASGVIQVTPEEVVAFTESEVRLKDGRVLRGTVARPRFRMATSPRELSVDPVNLEVFRAARPAGDGTLPATIVPTAAPVASDGLPTLAAYQRPDPLGTAPDGGARLEVVASETTLVRDAYAAARPTGHVTRGEQLVYLDQIDRRLRILGMLVFDGGHWIKVRTPDGMEGWLPAATVRQVR